MSVERFIAPDGMQLAFRYDDFTDPGSEAPHMLLHHSFPKNGDVCWITWVPHLGRHLRIIRPDLRGFGLSQVPLETYNPGSDLFIRDYIALLDYLKIDKVVWVGEGAGSLLGFTIAAKHPERISALILCEAVSWIDGDQLNAVAGTGSAGGHKEKSSSDAVWFGWGNVQSLVKYGTREYARYRVRNDPQMKQCSKAFHAWYEEQVAMTDNHRASKAYEALMDVDCRPFLKDIQAPTLLLYGSHSSVSTEEDHKYIMDTIPNARTVIIEGPSIGLPYAAPDSCAWEVNKFLAELGTVSQAALAQYTMWPYVSETT